jgi:Uma2 family endonuclease
MTMVSETHTRPDTATTAAIPWPPDDTEESVLGIDLHQTTITNLRWGINELARVHQPAGQPLPWQASTQLLITGCRRPDNSYVRVLPDVFVYPHAVDPYRGSWSIAVDGPPVLIIEVLSATTQANDLDLVRGKGYSYAQAGVREYLILDPTGEYLPEQGQGWRLVGGVYQPWERDGEGHWQSESIAAAFGVAGIKVSVYNHQGRPMLREGEVEAELSEKNRALAERDAKLAERDARLAERDAELARERALREHDQAELARLRRLAGEDPS